MEKKEKTVINFSNVSKKFKKGRKLLLKEAILDIFKPGKTDSFWALKEVSFNIKEGETIGIIGNNGSGKSTILKLIAGVMSPESGKIEVNGSLAPLIELGAGFHPELTGRENIYLNATILGLKRKDVDNRFDGIVEFSELGDFIDTPVKHYSSGMYMRLGFAIAVNITPDILLVDEILAVGDEKFRTKCINRMRDFQRDKKTIVFVSHSLSQVKEFCDRVIYLKDGQIEFIGKPLEAIKKYRHE